MESVVTECSVGELDYVRAHYTHMRPRPAVKVLGWVLVATFALVLALTGRQLLRIGIWYPSFWYIALPLAYLAFSLFVWRPSRWRRIYRQSPHPGRPFSFTATETAAEFQSPTGFARIPWSDFRKWKEGKSAFLLYYNDVLFHVLPKSCFTPQQQAVLRAVLSQHLRRVA